MRPVTLFRLATVLVGAALAAGPAAAQGPPGGPEILLNVTTAGDQVGAAAAVEADGGFVVAWRSGASVVARRLDAVGTPRSGEIPVNVIPIAGFTQVTVAAHPAGGFLVAWHAPDADTDGIWARRFDAAGQAVGGEMALNATVAGRQGFPRAAAGAQGYVVVWETAGGTGVFARRFDAAVQPLTGDIFVGAGSHAAVAARPNGFVVAWAPGNANGEVHVRRFDSAGIPVGASVVANGANPPPPPPGFGFWTRDAIGVASASSGAFTVAWHVSFFGATGGFMPMPAYFWDFGSYLRRFDAAGTPASGEIKLNTFEPGWQTDTAVASAPSGATFAAWSSVPGAEGCSGPICFPPPSPPPPQDGSGSGVYARLFDANGVDVGGGEFRVNEATLNTQQRPALAMSDSSFLAAFEADDGSGLGIKARRYGQVFTAVALAADPSDELFSDGNGVFENWEAVVVAPSWRNTTMAAHGVTSTASAFSGPAGAAYDVVIGSTSYGWMPPGATVSCQQGGQCFLLTLYANTRPAAHWDAQFTETLAGAPAPPRTWTLHVGDSFVDVPRSSPYYRFVETVFHKGVMPACATGVFCSTDGVSRQTMAQFVLKAASPGFQPPACVYGATLFLDMPFWNPYCPWVEELARRGVVAGCGGGNYCPTLAVSRETMAVYMLLTKEGTGYAPPACAVPIFSDVPASSPFCRWIEELARRGVVGGCAPGFYCPTRPVARDQMSVFLTGTFGLTLYGP
jgi:hypothetical protein